MAVTQAEIEAAYRAHRKALGTPLEAMKIALEAAERVRWQPIETAPKDRTFIFLLCEEDSSTWLAAWQSVCWYGVDNLGLTRTSETFKPTRWQPLPSPPEELNDRSTIETD